MNTYKTTKHEFVKIMQLIKKTFEELKNLEYRLYGDISDSYTEDLKNMILDLDIVNDDIVKFENYIKSKTDKIIIVLE